MEKKYLIVNIGSASKKYAVFGENGELCSWHFEREEGAFIATVRMPDQELQIVSVSESEYNEAVSFVLKYANSKGIINEGEAFVCVGMRVVAPGDFFTEHRAIDGEYMKKLNAAGGTAPLHIKPILSEIENIKKILPEVPVMGISDSAFHVTMPEYAKLYGLPREDAEKLDIYRFGYHGISNKSILRATKSLFGKLPEKVVVCHLGGGVSITAVKDGKSVDTSMGFTPLEGVPMGTRVGNIDAGAVLHLMRNLPDGESLDDYFNHKSGLFGVSGESGDIRDLLKSEISGDKKAKDALELFVYHIKKCVGAYIAALHGIDLLVFSGTIGERSGVIRSRILNGMQPLGIVFDETLNNGMISTDGLINGSTSRTKIAVIISRETEEIYIETKECMFQCAKGR